MGGGWGGALSGGVKTGVVLRGDKARSSFFFCGRPGDPLRLRYIIAAKNNKLLAAEP